MSNKPEWVKYDRPSSLKQTAVIGIALFIVVLLIIGAPALNEYLSKLFPG